MNRYGNPSHPQQAGGELGQAPDPMLQAAIRHLQTWSEPLQADIKHLLGVIQSHKSTFEKAYPIPCPLIAGLTAPATVLDHVPLAGGMLAQGFIIDNPGEYVLFLPSISRYVPPNVYNYPLRCQEAISTLTVQMLGGASLSAYTAIFVATETILAPTAALGNG